MTHAVNICTQNKMSGVVRERLSLKYKAECEGLFLKQHHVGFNLKML